MGEGRKGKVADIQREQRMVRASCTLKLRQEIDAPSGSGYYLMISGSFILNNSQLSYLYFYSFYSLQRRLVRDEALESERWWGVENVEVQDASRVPR